MEATRQADSLVFRVQNRAKLFYIALLVAVPSAFYNVARDFGSGGPLPAGDPVVLVAVGLGVLLASFIMIEGFLKRVTLQNNRLYYRALRGSTVLPLDSIRYVERRGAGRAAMAVIGGPTGSVTLSGFEFDEGDLDRIVGFIRSHASEEGRSLGDEGPHSGTLMTKALDRYMKFATMSPWRLAAIVLIGLVVWTVLSGRAG
jgi:hypothetical protein